jgi:hypothetical protein
LDPVLLLWWMRGRVHRDRLPPRRVVVQFDFRGAPTDSTLWLLLDPTDVSVCLTPPGFDVDLLVTADLAALYRVWLGRAPLAAAMRDGAIHLDGPRGLVRAFPSWWALSPTAPAVRAASSRSAADARPAGDSQAAVAPRSDA